MPITKPVDEDFDSIVSSKSSSLILLVVFLSKFKEQALINVDTFKNTQRNITMHLPLVLLLIYCPSRAVNLELAVNIGRRRYHPNSKTTFTVSEITFLANFRIFWKTIANICKFCVQSCTYLFWQILVEVSEEFAVLTFQSDNKGEHLPALRKLSQDFVA